jgi:hypothetical protein
MSHHLDRVMQHAGATGNPQYIAPRAIYLSGKMNANTCLIGSSLVNNVDLLENACCTCRGSWKPRRWMLNENIVDKLVSLLGEFSGQLLEYFIIGNMCALFGPGLASSKISLHLKWCLFQFLFGFFPPGCSILYGCAISV